MSRVFVVGDIHGAFRALRQCLQKCNFDYDRDTLICLGDVTDGWPETREAIEELMKIKNLVYLLGNHDFWTLEWMESGYSNSDWLLQGGQATVNSYHHGIPDSHIQFLRQARRYYEWNNNLFVHAGVDPSRPVHQQGLSTLIWDRVFVERAKSLHKKDSAQRLTSYKAVYVGHTPIEKPYPVKVCEVWMMDTGAGWSGNLTIQNLETDEHFVSDPVPALYPGVEGRKKY